MIGVQPEPGPPAGDPQRLIRPHAREHGPALLQPRRDIRKLLPAHDQVQPELLRRGLRQVTSRDRLRCLRAHEREHGVLAGDVGGLDAQHEPHRFQELQQRPGRARLDVRPQVRPVVGQDQVVLDVPVRAQDQRLGGVTGREVLKVLGGEAVQPGQPVRAADPDHPPVRPVDQAQAAVQRALLGERVAVVRGDPGVGPFRIGGDRPGRRQQRAVFPSRLRGPARLPVPPALSFLPSSPGRRLPRSPPTFPSSFTGSGAPRRLGHERQSRQVPNTVRCPTSVSKPSCSSRAVTSGRAASGATSVTRPQSRQTRCTCWASAARW